MVNVFKLINGDEIISEFVHNEEEQYFMMTNPVQIMGTHEGIGMGPYSPFIADRNIAIDEEHVMFYGNVDDDILNAYNEKFGSGIVVAPSLKIVT